METSPISRGGVILSNRLAPCVDPRSLADFQSAPLVVPAGKCREIRFDESPPPPLGRIPRDSTLPVVERERPLTVHPSRRSGGKSGKNRRNFHSTVSPTRSPLRPLGNAAHSRDSHQSSDARVRWHSAGHRSPPIIVARPFNRRGRAVGPRWLDRATLGVDAARQA